jgi:hypothetical protein
MGLPEWTVSPIHTPATPTPITAARSSIRTTFTLGSCPCRTETRRDHTHSTQKWEDVLQFGIHILSKCSFYESPLFQSIRCLLCALTNILLHSFHMTLHFTNITEHSPYRESNHYSAHHKNHCFLWNMSSLTMFKADPSLNLLWVIQNQQTLLYIIYLSFILVLSSCLHISLLSGLFPVEI